LKTFSATIPTLYGRDGERLHLHGSAVSRMLRELETGIPACVTVTLVDGLVLSREFRKSIFRGEFFIRRQPTMKRRKHQKRAEFCLQMTPKVFFPLNLAPRRHAELGDTSDASHMRMLTRTLRNLESAD
jgi:nitroimidazol reductase NimA-like FMN-containing flavoprotein (pyridoxamine 5'-phosphate oxidase superfamily)